MFKRGPKIDSSGRWRKLKQVERDWLFAPDASIKIGGPSFKQNWVRKLFDKWLPSLLLVDNPIPDSLLLLENDREKYLVVVELLEVGDKQLIGEDISRLKSTGDWTSVSNGAGSNRQYSLSSFNKDIEGSSIERARCSILTLFIDLIHMSLCFLKELAADHNGYSSW